MTFEYPWFLAFALLIPLFFYCKRKKKSRSFSLTLGDWGGQLFFDESVFAHIAYKAATVLLCASFLLFTIATAQPQVSHTQDLFKDSGVPVLFLVDVSPSMSAADMDNGQNRLSAAVDFIRNFVSGRPGDSAGLVAAGSSAVLLVPPTRDRDTLFTRLDMLNPGELGSGTALGDAVALAAVHLATAKLAGGVAVLITDGENNGGSVAPQTAAATLKERGFILYVVGTGTKGTVPVDYTDSVTGKRYTGHLDSAYDELSLRNLALSGGGTYFSATDNESLGIVLQEIASRHTPAPPVFREPEFEYAGTPFIIAALICAACAWILRRLCAGCVL